MATTIERSAFFDTLREHFDLTNVNETRIHPTHIEVFRFVRENGHTIIGEDGNPVRTHETIWLTSPHE